jgi:5'-nucleotidase
MAKKHPANTDPIRLSFLLTNDLHGHLTPNLTYLATLTQKLRSRPEYQSDEAALFVLDAGDQFQGTLLSNFNEGQSLFKVMNEIGYDAVIPGNHDYDFGPLGWLYDQVTPGMTSNNPREVIEKLARSADFPLLSANTYLKNSLRSGGKAIDLDSECKPLNATPSEPIDFENGRRPAFLTPYRIFKKAGVRVAIIGLDNHATATTTTKENVSDLCFRDEVASYLEIRKSLDAKADVFVALMHNGDADQGLDATEITRKINASLPGGVDLVAAGHTHSIHDHVEEGIHIIQDGANGKAYGRIDLYFDPVSKKVLKEKTIAAAGVRIDPETCTSKKGAFPCEEIKFPLNSNPQVDAIVSEAIRSVDALAKKNLATALGKIWVNRVDESPLANQLTDALRIATGTQMALLNTGGIRAPLLKGEVLYENLFETIPFQNQAVLIPALPWSTLKLALLAAAKTCGKYGALMQSGLKVRYRRDCSRAVGQIDAEAELISVQTLDGTVLYDQTSGKEASSELTLSVATLDFLASGGSGYSMLSGSSVTKKFGIFREIVSDTWSQLHPTLSSQIDDRFENALKK